MLSKNTEYLYNNFNLSNLQQSISKLEQIENNNIKMYYKQNVILFIKYN